MSALPPVIEISGRFADEVVASEVADALNRWFAWILGGDATVPEIFEPLGVDSATFAWTLGEDVDWQVGPHARTLGEEVRVSMETHETHLRLAGLLKRLGALTVTVVREDPDL